MLHSRGGDTGARTPEKTAGRMGLGARVFALPGVSWVRIFLRANIQRGCLLSVLRRMKAAWKAYEERMLPQLKQDKPGLKMSQVGLGLQVEFKQ